MTKHPVANLALSCLVSWSMILSGFMPAAQALADGAEQAPVYEVASAPAAQEGADQEDADAPAPAEPAPDAPSGDTAQGDVDAEPQPDPADEQGGEQTPADQPEE